MSHREAVRGPATPATHLVPQQSPVLAAMLFAMPMTFLDQTVVVIAAPDIVHRSGAAFTTGTCDNNGPWAGTASLKPAGVRVRDRVRTPDGFPAA
ncbi:hypothetical protein ACFP51_11720 [Streptomyces pratens]|uniref:Uncharacterized protein n=1 Tax=Streptomyces pratens TaxID=887456 RepID=A0ABW1LU17_9ACTN